MMELHSLDRTNSTRLNKDKQPSKIGILILFVITITLHGFGINQLNQTVIGIMETATEQTILN